MAIIVFVASAVYLIAKGNVNSKRIKILILISFAILLCYLLFQSNFLNVRDLVLRSNFYQRFYGDFAGDISEDSRLERKVLYIQHFESSILGGNHNRSKYGHAHDIVLDTYDEAGIFALIAITWFLLRMIKNGYLFLKNKSHPFQTKQVVLALYIALYAEFFVEPILQGVPWLFTLFCFIGGLIKSSNNASKAMR